MTFIESMEKAIDYIEENLREEVTYAEIARIALCSQYHFQRMFSSIVGVPLSEYIRHRRLTLAAFDLQNTTDKILEIALRYGYQSPDAFTRAFYAMHHVTPSKAREKGVSLKAYPRVTIAFQLKGVLEMNYRIEQKGPFTVYGVNKRLNMNDLGNEVRQMWQGLSPDTAAQLSGIGSNLVGAYSEMYEDNTTDYYIGAIASGTGADNLARLDVDSATWAIFEITGPLTDSTNAMAQTWGRIFSEWFPTAEYEHAPLPEIEWYTNGNMADEAYYCEIWIPIQKKA